MVWQDCLACQAPPPHVKVQMSGRLILQLTTRRLPRRDKLAGRLTLLLLQGVQVKAILELQPANHKALLTSRCLLLNLQRIQGTQQQLLRIQYPIRTKVNNHVCQPHCVACSPSISLAVKRETSSREGAVNNSQSTGGSLTPLETSSNRDNLPHLRDPALSELSAPLKQPTMAGATTGRRPPCAMCNAVCEVPLCVVCRNVWILGVLVTAHIIYYVLDYFFYSDK